MQVKYNTDMGRTVYYKDLKPGTPFQCVGSQALFAKVSEQHIFDFDNGQLISLGTPDEFLRVIPRLDAVVVFGG